MPSTSSAQHRFMNAAAHNQDFARKAGVPQSVAREFSAADKRSGKFQTNTGGNTNEAHGSVFGRHVGMMQQPGPGGNGDRDIISPTGNHPAVFGKHLTEMKPAGASYGPRPEPASDVRPGDHHSVFRTHATKMTP